MDQLPLLDVHTQNASIIWPSLKFSIATADFIAIDLELSGLGNRSKLSSKCLDERYAEIGNAAKTRSIISLGISCFKRNNTVQSSVNPSHYNVQTYNILALCAQPYIVEPQALQFLTRHGFDFNKQYKMGLVYNKQAADFEQIQGCNLNELFLSIASSNKPLVVHNGLVDLVFLYSNLYLPLPSKLSTFLADVEDLFAGGVYDTKYLTEYEVRLKASYLQYAFRTCLNWNEDQEEGVRIKFVELTASEDVCHVDMLVGTKANEKIQTYTICQQYAAHGWCPKGAECCKSHDVSLIVSSDSLNRVARKNRKRRLNRKQQKKRVRLDSNNIEEPTDDASNHVIKPLSHVIEPLSHVIKLSNGDSESPAASDASNQKLPAQNCHRAGLDAFMTGYCFAIFTAQLKEKGADVTTFSNKLYLSGKNIPLQVTKGNFAKLSPAHSNKRTLSWQTL